MVEATQASTVRPMQSSSEQFTASEVDIAQPNSVLDFTTYEQGDWQFIHSNYPMSNQKEVEQAEDKVGINGLPEVFYGNNHLYIVNAKCDLLFEIDPVASLSLCSFAKREEYLRQEAETEVEDKLESSEGEKTLNKIDLIPSKV